MFQDPSTTLDNCMDFNVSIDPDLFGKIDAPLPCQQHFTLMYGSPGTSGNCSSITYQFDDIYVINQVMFGAWPMVWEDSFTCGEEAAYQHEIRNPYMYILAVSKNGSDWTTVIDHSFCKCYFTQDLYFPRHAAKYLLYSGTSDIRAFVG